MKLEIILVTLLCFTSLNALQKNGDSIKFEVGGASKTAMKDMIKKITGIKDDTVGGEGSGDDDEDGKEGSGLGVKHAGSGVKDTGSGVQDTGSGAISATAKTILDGKKTTPEVYDITVVKSSKTTTQGNVINPGTTKDPFADPEVGKSVGSTKSEKTGVNFTVGIIVGVVVGAILAILVIVFLVYRLRKKDEGSYSLDEQSSTAFIRDEKSPQGKEYYA